MKRSIQHELLTIQVVETSQWTYPIHDHNHFELILIRTGSGQHIINGNRFTYQAGDVFLLGPLDNHYFVVDRITCFCSLSFTELYMRGLMTPGTDCWPQITERGQTASQQLAGSLIADRIEQQNLNALVGIVLTEQNNHRPLVSNQIVEALMKTILSLLDRQLSQHQRLSSTNVSSSSLMQRIGVYICHYITMPEHLRMEKMADVFNYSQSHLAALFKQQAGESISQYIIRYKLQLVETRLRLSGMSISQIADEFGFTDICHLNKLFKRYYQTTPTEYRRSLLVPNRVRNTYLQSSFNLSPQLTHS
ncbi:helix-turn-helix transcriptional regulator [Spirosoma validum]|uniref:Helix-turn-helix transcriptional regulator n=1 Tax=Spirosoma validum TaxID=2771355 RepID=A0A927B7N8_9BACT|nr:AraC family transcriptional regulator [Spirosoma validum]MBD2757249.1 helix-turn-helix transcriptional regulator [Spirosoma validum]